MSPVTYGWVSLNVARQKSSVVIASPDPPPPQPAHVSHAPPTSNVRNLTPFTRTARLLRRGAGTTAPVRTPPNGHRGRPRRRVRRIVRCPADQRAPSCTPGPPGSPRPEGHPRRRESRARRSRREGGTAA